MSRCFPYPPPGYEAKSRVEGLIDSFKLQKEKDKAKKEKKEKKKEKREKKDKNKSSEYGKLDEKKHSGEEGGKNKKKSSEHGKLEEKKHSSEEGGKNKKKSSEHGKLEEKKHSIEERGKDEKSQINQEGVHHKKRKIEEIEQVEKSSVTEEHGQPSGTLGFYDSSDSTQRSGKRKKHDIGVDADHNHGSGLRIRLPLLKRKVPELPSNEEPACSSGKADNLEKEPGTAGEYLPSNKEQPCSSGRVDNLAKGPETPSKYNAFESGILKMEPQFRELLVNWKPPQLQIEHPELDNQDWLFERKQQCKHVVENPKVGDDLNFESFGMGPRACDLSAADVYALPYVVPY